MSDIFTYEKIKARSIERYVGEISQCTSSVDVSGILRGYAGQNFDRYEEDGRGNVFITRNVVPDSGGIILVASMNGLYGPAIVMAAMENADLPVSQAVFINSRGLALPSPDPSFFRGSMAIVVDDTLSPTIYASGAGSLGCTVTVEMREESLTTREPRAYTVALSGAKNIARIMTGVAAELKSSVNGIALTCFSVSEAGDEVPAACLTAVVDRFEEIAFRREVFRIGWQLRREFGREAPGFGFEIADIPAPERTYSPLYEPRLTDLLDLLPLGEHTGGFGQVCSEVTACTVRSSSTRVTVEVRARTATEYTENDLRRRIGISTKRCGAECSTDYRIPAWSLEPACALYPASGSAVDDSPMKVGPLAGVIAQRIAEPGSTPEVMVVGTGTKARILREMDAGVIPQACLRLGEVLSSLGASR